MAELARPLVSCCVGEDGFPFVSCLCCTHSTASLTPYLFFLFQDPSWQYMLCFQNSLALSTGYGGPYPVTKSEHIFSLFVVAAGISTYVVIIGAVGALIQRLDATASMFQQQVDNVSDYMKYRGIPIHLQRRVHSYYNYLWESRRGVDEVAVAFSLCVCLSVFVYVFDSLSVYLSLFLHC